MAGEEEGTERKEETVTQRGVCVCRKERAQPRVLWIFATGSTSMSSLQPQALLREREKGRMGTKLEEVSKNPSGRVYLQS